MRINTVQLIIKYEKPKACILNILPNDEALQYSVDLNSVSSQCARGKSSFTRKTEVHSNFFFNGKKTFKKLNPPDFKFYLGKLNNKKFPHMVQC